MRKFSAEARGLGRLVPKVDRLVTSPYVRARQTASLLNEVAGWPVPEVASGLAAGAKPEAMLNAALSGRNDAICALVGHEPDLSLLAMSLVGMQPPDEDAILFKNGGVAMLANRADGFESGAWTLHWLLSPRLLRAL